MQVTDRPSPDAPSLTQAIIVQIVYSLAVTQGKMEDPLKGPSELEEAQTASKDCAILCQAQKLLV